VPWAKVWAEATELAEMVSRRLAAHRHHVLATHRVDGSIRLSGIEVWQLAGALQIGMVAGSRKAEDVGRDPRFALHSQPEDRFMGPDIKLWGDLVALDGDRLAEFRSTVGPPEPFVAYEMRLVGVASTMLAASGAELEVRSWTVPGEVP
jgi:hypothetical protein